MLDPNFIIFARIIHEQRIEEALRKQRHWPRSGFNRPKPLATHLGNLLIALGLKLKRQATLNRIAEQPLA